MASTVKDPFLPDLEAQQEAQDEYVAVPGESELELDVPGASAHSGVFNLLTSVIGAGIMALPATTKHLGVVLGTVAIVLLGLLTDASLEILLRFSAACKARSYGTIMGRSYGTAGRIGLQICIIVNNIGLLIVYMIIIGDVLSGSGKGDDHHTGVLEELAGGSFWWNGRFFILLLTTLFVLIPLVSLKRIDSLRHSSFVSILLAIVFLIVTAGIFVIKLCYGEIGAPRLWPEVHDQFSFWNLFTAVPVIVTAYICHHSVHPILRELKEPGQIQKISRISITICTCVYIATALCGYLLFGEDTMADVLSNFDADLGIPFGKFASDVVRVFYAFHLMTVFPIINFSLRINLDALLFPKAELPVASHNGRFYTITGVLIIISFISSTMIPNIWTVFEFTGATAAVCLGFIFPGIIALRDAAKIATTNDKLVAGVMIVLAVVSSVISITTNIINIAS